MPSRRHVLVILAVTAAAAILLSIAVHGTASANPIGGIASVAAGESHTCALTTAGGVKCWGDNSSGQLGNGTLASSLVPVDVSGLSTGATAVIAGGQHTCALTTRGGVKCWGDNSFGQLGSPGGSLSTPTDVTGLTSGVAAITAGYDYTCALTSAGGVKCWGDNIDGQLGTGGSTTSTPTNVIATNAIAVDAGYNHTCAALIGGTVQCWGSNTNGQLGDGTNISRTTPVNVPGLTNVTALAAGLLHSCALTSSGGVLCWGFGYGFSPVPVSGLSSGVSAISSFYNHTCALTGSGGVKCWGDNVFGQLGDGMSCGVVCATPVAVAGLSSGVAAISVGIFHTCAAMASGNAKCWGINYKGQLGNGMGAIGLANSTPVNVVVSVPKPTPTPSPCSPCPTPSPSPTAPMQGLDFSLGVRVGNSEICNTRTAGPSKCIISSGSAFDVTVSLDSLPANLAAYVGFDAYVDFAGISSKGAATVVWPDCSSPVTNYQTTAVLFGCNIFAGRFSTSYTGPLGNVAFNCTQSGTVTLREGQGGSDLVDAQLRSYFANGQDVLTINCVPPTATPPRPVGGVSLDVPAGPASRGAGLPAWLVPLVFASAIGLAGSAVFAIRRAR
jgi:alpha-tubulin suppressor-like RCC1 family protein